MALILEGYYSETRPVSHRLVWQATHDGGGILLPYRKRSFISFSFGGKDIEEFDLIAYCKGDTMSRKGSADFEDLVTSYDIMDGLYYHGTHFKPYTLSLDLVSDGIDQLKLENFLHWFAGGQTRELVLAEHPNRAIMARVSLAPLLELLPFEEPVTIMLDSVSYATSTTLYKGTILLELVADGPFWYARLNFLIYNSTDNLGIFLGVSLNNTSDLFKEAIKVVYEDNVPLNSMVQSAMHFGEDKYAVVNSDLVYTFIARNLGTTEPEDWAALSNTKGYFTSVENGVTTYWAGAAIDGTKNNVTYYGNISGAVVVNDSSNVVGSLVNGNALYLFFYGGTAPSPTVLSFKVNLAPLENEDYINCIANSYAPHNGKEYSTITVESVHEKNFDFTTPNVITSWNKAYKMLNEIEVVHLKNGTNNEYIGTNWSDLIDNLRDYIRHPAVRAFAIALVSYLQAEKSTDSSSNKYYFTDNGIFTLRGKDEAEVLMKTFFQDLNHEYSTAEFVFDAEMGTAMGTFLYWQSANSNVNIVSIVAHGPTTEETEANFKKHVEDVGDMLRSNWLILEDRNQLVDNLYVSSWSNSHKWSAHQLTHNARGVLLNLNIKYKNRYL